MITILACAGVSLALRNSQYEGEKQANNAKKAVVSGAESFAVILKEEEKKIEESNNECFWPELKINQSYLQLIIKYAKKYNVSPRIMAALCKIESDGSPKARSSENAYGLMQCHLPTWNRYAREKLGLDVVGSIEDNIEFGCWEFRYSLDRCNGDYLHALGMYNTGRSCVNGYANKVYGLAMTLKQY